jgi:hypothetical protein
VFIMSLTRSVLFVIITLTAPLAALQHVAYPTEPVTPALVERVRNATLRFTDVRRAVDAGYGQFLGCVSGPQEGAMGVHFVNGALVADGELDADQPEALIYEPTNGDFVLVGVEFIVVADAWHAHHPLPPVLEGQAFQYNGSPNRYGLPPFYELHVWSARDNPHGTFVDWNTRVSCAGR